MKWQRFTIKPGSKAREVLDRINEAVDKEHRELMAGRLKAKQAYFRRVFFGGNPTNEGPRR